MTANDLLNPNAAFCGLKQRLLARQQSRRSNSSTGAFSPIRMVGTVMS